MDGDGRPQTELMLGEMKPFADEREYQQGDRIEDKYNSDGYRNGSFIGLHRLADCGDSAASANRCSHTDEVTDASVEVQPAAQEVSDHQGQRQRQEGEDETVAACFEHFVEIHAETQSDDGKLQQVLGGFLNVTCVGLFEKKTDSQSGHEGDGRRPIQEKYQNQQDEKRGASPGKGHDSYKDKRDILYKEGKTKDKAAVYSLILAGLMDKKLYYFSAGWCEPCQWASPIAEELFARLHGVVETQKVDIDKEPELAKEMHVLGVPCFILTESGEVRWRRNGFDTADRLLEELSPHL